MAEVTTTRANSHVHFNSLSKICSRWGKWLRLYGPFPCATDRLVVKWNIVYTLERYLVLDHEALDSIQQNLIVSFRGWVPVKRTSFWISPVAWRLRNDCIGGIRPRRQMNTKKHENLDSHAVCVNLTSKCLNAGFGLLANPNKRIWTPLNIKAVSLETQSACSTSQLPSTVLGIPTR